MFRISDFQVLLKIGQGSFASVMRATHKKTGHNVALKIYEKKHLKDAESTQALHREIYILAMIKHENIVGLHEVIDSRTHVHLIMELCEGKSLYHIVKKSQEKAVEGVSEVRVKNIFRQLLTAVAYMHENDIAHRDLKLDNILVDGNDLVKLIDFGFATKCVINEKLSFFCGTPHYMDPDLAMKKHYFGQAADVWALGVILFTLLSGKMPFFAEFEEDLFRRIQNAKYQWPRNYRQNAKNVE
jgi:MAP/microtubule affinity-regulating kinase